jgi:hypothetical protein
MDQMGIRRPIVTRRITRATLPPAMRITCMIGDGRPMEGHRPPLTEVRGGELARAIRHDPGATPRGLSRPAIPFGICA